MTRFPRLMLICLMLGLLPTVFGQNVIVTKSDWMRLQGEFQNLKRLSETLNKQVIALNTSLIEADTLQTTSNKIILDLQSSLSQAEQKRNLLETQILGLEKSLIGAENSGEVLTKQIKELKSQLSKLKVLLNDTRDQLEMNSNTHEQSIIDMATRYERRQGLLKLQRNALIVGVLVEAVVIGVMLLNR